MTQFKSKKFKTEWKLKETKFAMDSLIKNKKARLTLSSKDLRIPLLRYILNLHYIYYKKKK